MNKEDQMRETITELKRTIQYLCNQIENATALVDSDPALAKLMLKESINQPQYKYS